jgi:hypothetical protein
MLGNRHTLNWGAPGLILLATREAAVTTTGTAYGRGDSGRARKGRVSCSVERKRIPERRERAPDPIQNQTVIGQRHAEPADAARRLFVGARRGQPHRQGRLLAVLGISESEFVSRFTSPIQTDWKMTCTAKKVLRAAEQEPVVLPPAKASRAA